MKFEQCAKSFFLYRNFPFLRDKLPLERQLTFKRGHDVGALAQGLFPGGTDVSKLCSNTSEALVKTRELVEKACPVIYEAAFVHKSVLVITDILCLDNGRYTAYEVKSSLKVSETYLKDAYLQYYVLKNELKGFDDLFLVTLDASYEFEDTLELRKLFKKRSVKEKAESNLAYFEHRTLEAAELIEANQIPDMPVGMHCFRPYTCDFFGTCWKGLQGKNSLFNLPFTHKQELFEWYNQGIRTLDELDENMIGKAHTRRVRNALVRNEAFTDQESVSGFIKKLKSPYAAMDMEVWNPAIPQIRHSRPFEQIPFLAGFYAPGQEANVFMAYGQDERREFAIAFIEACKQYSSLLVYDKTMEIGILKALGLRFPELSIELEEIQHKILDLFDLILHHHYYHPGFGSNLSLKSVSSVLLPAHAYGRIQSGLEAMAVYEDFRRDENPIQQQIARDELIEYCMNDCKAVYELVEFFKSL